MPHFVDMCMHVCVCLHVSLCLQLYYILKEVNKEMFVFRTEEDFVNVAQTYTSGEWSGYLVADKVGFGDFSINFALITSSTCTFDMGWDIYWPLVSFQITSQGTLIVLYHLFSSMRLMLLFCAV